MSTLRTNTLQDAAGGSSVPMATVAAGTAKAWVNFNGTGTVAIRAAFNVSSITDNGTGDYTVNFTTSMTDANYSFAQCVQLDAGGADNVATPQSLTASRASAMAAGSIRLIAARNDIGTFNDVLVAAVSVFR